MKKISIFSAIIGLLIYGCSSNEEVYNNYHKEGDKSFRVTVEQPVCNETRAQLDNDYNVVFEDNDKIAVFDKKTAISEYTYSSTDAKFSGTSSTEGEALEGIFALYPYSEDKTYNSGTLPDKQTYCANSFSNESQIMYGQTDKIENGFNLKNMCGYIRLHLYGENVFVKDITLSVTGEGEYVSGDFQIGASDNGDDYALTMNNEGENQKQSVKLVCPDGGVELGTTSENATIFYIALPPQKYTKGFTVTSTDIFGREFTKSAFTNTGFELERNHIKPMEALKVSFGADELVIVKGTGGNQYAKVDTPDELLKWGQTLNNVNKNLGLILENDIELPLKTVEKNPDGTYQFTDTPIELNADGTPTGSNWISVCSGISSLSEAFSGHIDGNGKTIKGLRILQNTDQVGFIGAMFDDASIKNLTFEDVVVKGNTETGAVAGRSHNGTLIENVHVVNSKIFGTSRVGGIVGMNYRRVKTGLDEELSYIKDCTTDNQTVVTGSDAAIGGICGRNDGAIILHCTNKADVIGSSEVGGVVGHTCSYNTGGINGYVIASCSMEDAEITGSNNAGGIVGYTYLNPGHANGGSKSYVVACCSKSTVTSPQAGTIAGSTHDSGYYGQIISSWAKQSNNMNYSGNNKIVKSNLIDSDHYADASGITQDIVDQMNQAIATYNTTTGVEQKCPYIWTKENDNSWPVLELAPENAD